MSVKEHAWEQETRKYLAEIRGELAEVEQQLSELQARRDALAHETEALNTALAVYFRRTGRGQMSQPDVRELLIAQPNHKERIKLIAKQNSGLLRIGDAADILYTYRIMKTKSKMSAYRIIYGLTMDMVDEGVFEKIAPGEFRLLGTQAVLANKIV